jgi:subtilisin family serine protease
MSTGFGRTQARLARLVLCAIFAVSFLALRAHAQTVEPQRWVRTAIQDAPKAPDAALADKVRTRGVRVIARLREEAIAPAGIAAAQAIAGSQDRIARRLWNRGHSMPGWHAFRSVPAVVMEVDIDSLQNLAADAEVESVEEDRLAKPDLATSVPLVNAPSAWSQGFTGSGVAVAVLDTGVDRSHPFFGNRVVHEACFSSTYAEQDAVSLCPNGASSQTGTGAAAACSVSGCFHGTHVAGIAAGHQSASFAGVARDAQIIAIQVFTRFNSAALCGGASSCVMSYTSDQIRALDHVLQLRASYTIASVNMSFGGSAQTSQATCDSRNVSTKQAIDALRAVGIATVIASGNDGYANAISEPGCISTAISVGNVNNSDQAFVPFNIASFITMVAPGSFINSSVPGGSFMAASGTSMAAPHVAGAIAILRQAAPAAGVNEIVAALRSGGKSLTLTINAADRIYTHTVPRLDVAGALAALCTTCNTASVTGWWWNPAEPGRGFSIETRNGRLYLGAFLYEDDGAASWYVVNGPGSGAGYSGPLAKFGLGQTLAGDYKPAQLLGTAGNASISFAASTSATLTWPGGTVALQRFPVNGQSVVAKPAGAPETGWWWNPSESGTGWFFEVQGSNIFLAGYLYDGSGRPVWYVSSGSMLSPTSYDGNLQLYAGGQTLTGGYRAPTSSAPVGQVSLRFTTPTTATITLPTGRTVALSRFTNF